MGVEYRCYLLPRPNTFRPHPRAVFALVAAMREDGWLLDSTHPGLARLPFEQSRLYKYARGRGYFALAVGSRTPVVAPMPDLFDDYAGQDLLTVWPVESLAASGLRYPLEPLPFDDPADAEDCYYEVQFHFGHDFIYHVSECINPFDPLPTCPRGHPVGYEPASDVDPFYSARKATRCPQCGEAFDPTRLIATGRDGWTGAATNIQGGATYRFAVVIDCGKFFGRRRQRFHPRLKSLVERTLGIETYEVEDFY